MKELKLEKLSNFLNDQGLFYETFKVNIIKQAVVTPPYQQQHPPDPQAKEKRLQQEKIAVSNLDEAINAFVSLLNNIAGSPQNAEKLLRHVQKATGGPIFDALMKAVTADYDEIDAILKQGQQQQGQQQQVSSGGSGSVVQKSAWTAKILAQTPKFKSLGESIHTAVMNLVNVKNPDMKGGFSPELTAIAKYEINEAINRNQMIKTPEAKQVIKELILRFVG